MTCIDGRMFVNGRELKEGERLRWHADHRNEDDLGDDMLMLDDYLPPAARDSDPERRIREYAPHPCAPRGEDSAHALPVKPAPARPETRYTGVQMLLMFLALAVIMWALMSVYLFGWFL